MTWRYEEDPGLRRSWPFVWSGPLPSEICSRRYGEGMVHEWVALPRPTPEAIAAAVAENERLYARWEAAEDARLFHTRLPVSLTVFEGDFLVPRVVIGDGEDDWVYPPGGGRDLSSLPEIGCACCGCRVGGGLAGSGGDYDSIRFDGVCWGCIAYVRGDAPSVHLHRDPTLEEALALPEDVLSGDARTILRHLREEEAHVRVLLQVLGHGAPT